MSVENIILFHSVLDEALERLGEKNLKLKECQYEAVKAVVVDRKDTICIFPIGHGKSLIYQLLPYCGLLNLFICNACAVRATYSFLYVDHGLSQSLRFLPKGSQARGTRLAACVSPTAWFVSRTTPSFAREFLALDSAVRAITPSPITFVAKSTILTRTTTSPRIPRFTSNRGILITARFARARYLRSTGLSN